MKNYIYLITLFLSSFVYGQAPRGFYLVAGYSQEALKSSDLLLSKSGPGYYAGIRFNLGYHETYNYQIDVTYGQNTFNLKSVNGDFTSVNSTKFKCSNIELGLYLNYYVLKPDEDKFFIGPQFGVYTQYGTSLDPVIGNDGSSNNYLPYLLDDSDFDHFSKINYGTGFGLTGGYNNLRFDLRYSLGLANMLNEVQTNSYDDNNRYTGPKLKGTLNSISFGISYNIFHFRERKK